MSRLKWIGGYPGHQDTGSGLCPQIDSKKTLKHQFLTAIPGKEKDLAFAVLTRRKMKWLTSLAEVSTMKD